jgi:hypothetical protein
VHSAEVGAPEGMSLRVFANLRRIMSTGTSPYVNNSLFISSPFRFIKRKYFHGNMGTYKIGGVPAEYCPRIFCWGRSCKIHIKIKRELFTY